MVRSFCLELMEISLEPGARIFSAEGWDPINGREIPEFKKKVAYVGFSSFFFQKAKKGGGSSQCWKAVAFSLKCFLMHVGTRCIYLNNSNSTSLKLACFLYLLVAFSVTPVKFKAMGIICSVYY